MLFMLYHGGYETGQILSAALMEEMGPSKFKALTSLTRIRRFFKRGDSLLRWGTTRRRERDSLFTSRHGYVLNSADAILRNTNKLNSLRLFKKAGLNTPQFYTNKHDIIKFPVLGRDRNHTGGKDITIIEGHPIKERNDFSKIPNKDFYVDLLPSKAEYRVHVFNKEIVRVTKKVFRGHDKDGRIVEQKGIIKNDTFGWGHQNVDTDELNQDYLDTAIKAVVAIGLDFGAVDLLVCSSNNKGYVLEVNSCPRLGPTNVGVYTKAISNFFNI